tara:strand:- start:217 stop:531 length:315 start_codon:yes stop_codon:yes gene_type:complete
MNLTKLQLKKAVEEQIEKTLNEQFNSNSEIDREVLEEKMDQLSGDLVKTLGHVRLDTTNVLMGMITDSIIAKVQNSNGQPIEKILKEEVDTIIQGAVAGVRSMK